MYQEYYTIFDKHLKISPAQFLTEIINDGNLNRLVTDFQVLPLKDKIQQCYFTSMGVKLGRALEDIIQLYLTKKGANFNLDRRKVVEGHDCDQIFTFGDKTILIEQKIRDDHDSSKKRGQVENYLKKREVLLENFSNVFCCSWFVDNTFKKNIKYYIIELKDEVCYGKEIENFLLKVFEDDRCSGMYSEIISIFKNYRQTYNKIDIFSNLQLDYCQLQPKGIWELLIALKDNPDLETILFSKGLDKVQLLKYLRGKRSSEYTKKAIVFLEEEYGK